MRILVDIGHPAHVHFYKNAIRHFEGKGHEVKITARQKDIALQLLDAYDFDYINFGLHKKGMAGKSVGLLNRDMKLLNVAKKFKPDVLTGVHNMYVAHVGKIIDKPTVIFTDTEHGVINNKLTFPFTSVICTPSSFKADLGKKQVFYEGFHELAYLHPNHFKPDPAVLSELRLDKGEKFIIFRFVSWEASHDVAQAGLTADEKMKYLKALEEHGRVLITSEAELGKQFEKYKIKLAPEKIHDLLYYATMYIGEGGTMGSEAAVLGTPSIHCGVFEDLRDNFGLIHIYDNGREGLERALELLKTDAKSKWQTNRAKMLKRKIDVNKFIIKQIEEFADRR
jgi:predicted glycosyltransferase